MGAIYYCGFRDRRRDSFLLESVGGYGTTSVRSVDRLIAMLR